MQLSKFQTLITWPVDDILSWGKDQMVSFNEYYELYKYEENIIFFTRRLITAGL